MNGWRMRNKRLIALVIVFIAHVFATDVIGADDDEDPDAETEQAKACVGVFFNDEHGKSDAEQEDYNGEDH